MIPEYIRAEPDMGNTSQRNRNDILWLEQVKKVVTPSLAAYVVTPQDDYVLCSSITTTVTLPLSARGRDLYVIKNYAGGSLTVIPVGTDTIFGASNLVITARESKHFKAIAGGYIVI